MWPPSDVTSKPIPYDPDSIKKWCETEPYWEHRIGKGWHPVEAIGQGESSIVILWEYNGVPEEAAPEIKQVALKVFHSWSGEEALADERINHIEEMLDILTVIGGSKHFPRIYGPIRKDNEGRPMIFQEYVSGGNLRHVMNEYIAAKRKPEEADLWSIFLCLAKAVMAMDCASEDPRKLRWRLGEIYHGDISPENIWIGYKDQEHEDVPIIKLGDFESATYVPRLDDQTNEYGENNKQLMGLEAYRPPEELVYYPTNDLSLDEHDDYEPSQYEAPLRNPRFGTCSNIFQIGMVMYELMTQSVAPVQENQPESYWRRDFPGMFEGSKVSYGHRVLGLSEYSDPLKKLVIHCLMREPLERPRAQELLESAQAGNSEARREEGWEETAMPWIKNAPRIADNATMRPPEEWLLKPTRPVGFRPKWYPMTLPLDFDPSPPPETIISQVGRMLLGKERGAPSILRRLGLKSKERGGVPCSARNKKEGIAGSKARWVERIGESQNRVHKRPITRKGVAPSGKRAGLHEGTLDGYDLLNRPLEFTDKD